MTHDHRRKIARLDQTIFFVALLWLVASAALLLSSRRHDVHASNPSPQMRVAIHSSAAAQPLRSVPIAF